jgi:hypothetical protein
VPDVAGQGFQIPGIETGQRRPQLIAGITVNTHPGGNAHAEKASSKVLDESLHVEQAGDRVLVTLVDVYVVAVDKPFETQLAGLGDWLSALISRARALN